MKLSTDQLPAGALDEAIAGLSNAMRPMPSEPSITTFSERRPRFAPTAEVFAPHPLYMFDIDDVHSEHGLDAARHVGWRLMVSERGQRARSSAWGYVDLAGATEPHFARLRRGATAEGLAHAIRQAESLPDEGQYDLRSLDVPAVYVTLLWLDNVHADDWRADRLIVASSRIPQIRVGDFLSGDQLVHALEDETRGRFAEPLR